MSTLIVVEHRADWKIAVPETEILEARDYLSDVRFAKLRQAKVFNLCRSYRYQSAGYYVSLLGEARGHKPMPNITTIQDMKSLSLVRSATEHLEELLEKNLAGVQGQELLRFIIFGHSLDGRFESLSNKLFRLFPAPFLRVTFARQPRAGTWSISSLAPVAPSSISQEYQPRVEELAQRFFSQPAVSPVRQQAASFYLAILRDPKELEPPSNFRALQNFVKASEELGMATEFIDRDDYGRLPEFDALFIRETTHVNHHTYRFARRSAAEGIAVIDDAMSILRCTNKVYLTELLCRHNIAIPDTRVVHAGNALQVLDDLGLPCVLKLPDSSFSQGVIRLDTRLDYVRMVKEMLEHSDLLVAQRFVPTEFDWRVGVFDRQPLYVCKYYMAKQHWQIIKRNRAGLKVSGGTADTLPIEQAPARVVQSALKAANLIGDGLYGVDLKEVNGRCLVIEVNDNPNIDAGVEDSALGPALYRTIMEGFLRRIQKLRSVEKRA